MDTQTSLANTRTPNEQRNIPPNHVRFSISLQNKGTVKFGKFSTKKFEFQGDLRIGKNTTIEAIPAEGSNFRHWLVMHDGATEFSFSTDEIKKTFKPSENITIRAIFSLEESR